MSFSYTDLLRNLTTAWRCCNRILPGKGKTAAIAKLNGLLTNAACNFVIVSSFKSFSGCRQDGRCGSKSGWLDASSRGGMSGRLDVSSGGKSGRLDSSRGCMSERRYDRNGGKS